ncbi:MAG TPA: hypothetical protein VFW33_20725, partial [Gemmataceae bacterium]|nr:hypothetical protein [Gemmataceae bacterium]
EDRTAKAWTAAKLEERTVYPKQPDTPLALAVRGDGKQLAVGRYDGAVVLFDEASGKVQSQPLPVKPKAPEPKKPAPAQPADPFPKVDEVEPNNSPTAAQEVALPASIHGAIAKAGDVDYYRFRAKAGQEVGAQAQPTAGSKLDPVLVLTDGAGRVVAEGSGTLGYTCPTAGTYALGLRDRDYRGGADMPYRLHVGNLPVVTSVFPLGVQRGTEQVVTLEGVNLGGTKTVRVKAPADAAPGTRIPVSVTAPHGAPLGNPSVVVGEFPEAQGLHPLGLAPPFTANGRIDRPGASESWTFSAKQGHRLILEVNARRLGSRLDSVIEVLGADGRPVQRAVLRAVAKTNIVFRDHDSTGGGIRIDAWSELRVNDYLYVGGELLRIRELPKNPDDDCQFWSAGGQRLGWLGTTPIYHPLGEAMYKVTIHPPGTTFPPNGFPVIALPYRNDDGGPGYGKDSRLVFDPPADGEYQVRVGDADGRGGVGYGYRLTVRPPRPDFRVSLAPAAPAVWKGGAVPVSINVERLDDFAGKIEVRLENLPPGFSAPASNILPEDSSTAIALSADASAASPPAASSPLKVVARATIDGKEVVREAAGALPKVIDGGDIVTTAGQSEVTLRPGGETRLTVTVERHNGFTGRIPLEVRGLPHGVRVLDVGLNGILITEKETTRTIVIHAEPWVEPGAHPFVVLARSERKGTEHAAKSVLLKVEAAGR